MKIMRYCFFTPFIYILGAVTLATRSAKKYPKTNTWLNKKLRIIKPSHDLYKASLTKENSISSVGIEILSHRQKLLKLYIIGWLEGSLFCRRYVHKESWCSITGKELFIVSFNNAILAYHWSIKMYTGLQSVI